jgi:hypothetical protein
MYSFLLKIAQYDEAKPRYSGQTIAALNRLSRIAGELDRIELNYPRTPLALTLLHLTRLAPPNVVKRGETIGTHLLYAVRTYLARIHTDKAIEILGNKMAILISLPVYFGPLCV